MHARSRIAMLLFAFLVAWSPRSDAVGEAVGVEISDAITPVSARRIVEGVRAAESEGAEFVIIQLDTPGGLDTAMREATKAILGSSVPVVVWVGPPGARAASAGMFLTIAAHVAAMAPGTNIGAAHPVGMGGMGQPDSTMASKVVNDAVAYARSIATSRGRNADWVEKGVRESASIDAETAVATGVVDLIAEDIPSLLRALDGRVVRTAASTETLRTEGVAVREREMSFRERLLSIITNPNIAYLLFLAGILGIFFELSTPGAILPGVIGGISLILALFAFQTLTVNLAGILLVMLAVVMFLLEIKVPSHGLLSIGGVISLLLGSLMLFRGPAGLGVSLAVVIPAIVLTAGFFVFAVAMALKAQRRSPVTGAEGMVGRIGTVIEDLRPEGRVLIHGELWTATAPEEIRRGERVRVVSVDGLHLDVTRSEG